MDMPSTSLLQQLNAKEVSGEHLELLGKKAAASWCNGQVATLSNAVVETVKHAGLSPEQVKRVVEFANTEAYLTEFRKEGSGHRVVQFEGGPAIPGDVLRDLNDGGGGSVFDSGTGDYRQPVREKTASAEEEAAFAAMFAGAGEAVLPDHNPFRASMELRDKLAHVYETATAELSTLENMYGDLIGRCFHNVKQAALSGHALSEVAQIWADAAPSDAHVKVAFAAIFPELVSNGVFADTTEVVASLEKVAHVGTVNPDHPLVSDFRDFCDVLSKLAEKREEQQEAGEGVARLTSFITKEGGDEGLLQKGINMLDRAGNAAGGVGERVGDALLGKGKGAPLGTAARVATKYVLPAVGAHEVYRRTLKHNPGFQAAKQTALGTIPGTAEYNQKELELQMQAQGYGGQGY